MKKIFEHQKYLMEKVYKLSHDPKAMVDHYRIASLALVDEVMEALHHAPWKPWSKRATWEYSKLHSELVDVFTFFVELCQLAGLSAEELEKGYFRKAEVNKARQDSGTYGIEVPNQYNIQDTLTQRQLENLYEVAERGECTSAKVGCLIVTENGQETWGYNFAASGHPCAHLASEGCNGRTVHAEAAAVADAARLGLKTANGVAYVTQEPCERCFTMLARAGIKDVWVV